MSTRTPKSPAPKPLEELGNELGLAITVFEPSPKTPKPYWHDAAHGLRLYRDDALELLRRAKPETFDLVFADPPYFLSNDGITCQNGKMVSVNKGAWDKAQTFEQIHDFNLQWLRECKRVLKPNGTIWVSGTNHNIYSVGFALQTLEFKVLNDIAWFKVNPPPNLACRYFTHATETIIWARREPKGKHVFHYEEMKRDNRGKQMQSLWSITPPATREKRYGKHPTQKPEALLDRIIRASSNPGDLVLDPFCGSGTTGVLCARLGRRFVGFDISDEYLDLAIKRLGHEICVPQLFSCSVRNSAVVVFKPQHKTWVAIVYEAIIELGGVAHLRDINNVVKDHSRVKTNRTWPCTIRRVVRQSALFQPLGKGTYKLRVEENYETGGCCL